MTGKQFYDWQTLGGTDDVTRFVNALEKADIVWCVMGGRGSKPLVRRIDGHPRC